MADEELRVCLPFCRAIIAQPGVALQRKVVDLLEPFWKRCGDADEPMERTHRYIGLWSKHLYHQQMGIEARAALEELGQPEEDSCSQCRGGEYVFEGDRLILCEACMGSGWNIAPAPKAAEPQRG